MLAINEKEFKSLKSSYFNVFACLMSGELVKSEYVECLFKWGIELGISQDELQFMKSLKGGLPFQAPTKLEAIEEVYNIVYMLNLDEVVEDIELEIAMIYAEKLGFKQHVVGDLLKAIVTAPHDGMDESDVRKELYEVLYELESIR